MILLGVALSLLVGLSLGLLGGGGSILMVPLLVYVVGVEPREAIAMSLLVVGVTSIAAIVPHARASNVAWRTGLVFGAAGMVGAFGGGLLAGWIPATVLLVLFALMMVATSVAMLRGRDAPKPAVEHTSALHIVLHGLVVGSATGLVGAGGGFLVVPALALLGGLPMHRAIGTSLLVISMKSFAGFAGHAAHVDVDLGFTALVTVAAVLGSIGGAALGHRIAADHLRRGFAWFVLAMAAFLLIRQLLETAW